ncbi:MAG: hypothetical protein ACK463_04635 [Bradyrhizobium sp.]
MTTQLADEASIVDRILNHIDAKSTDLSDGGWHEPVAHYLSQDRFAAEIDHVFRRTLTPFCPSAPRIATTGVSAASRAT